MKGTLDADKRYSTDGPAPVTSATETYQRAHAMNSAGAGGDLVRYGRGGEVRLEHSGAADKEDG